MDDVRQRKKGYETPNLVKRRDDVKQASYFRSAQGADSRVRSVSRISMSSSHKAARPTPQIAPLGELDVI